MNQEILLIYLRVNPHSHQFYFQCYLFNSSHSLFLLVITLPIYTLVPLLSFLLSDTSVILIHIMPKLCLKYFSGYSVFLK